MTNQTTDICKFFTALSERAYKENDLSDVTYAMCEANDRFKSCFLQFFFGKEFMVNSITKFQREHSKDDSRPDFWIETSNGLYLVEVKIHDGSHHFQKYFSILKSKNPNICPEENKKRLGYIAAYKIIADEKGKPTSDFSVKMWKEFKKQVEEELGTEDPFLNGYVEYLESVTDGMKVDEKWEFTINDFNQIGAFDVELHEILLTLAQKEIGTEYKTATSYYPLYRKGFYLDGVQVGDRSQCPFIGVYFGDENKQQLCVGFEREKNWGDIVCAEYENNEYLKRLSVDESEGVFFYPDTTKPTTENAQDSIKNVDCIFSEVSTTQRPLPPYRSIRNLVIKLRELFSKNNLTYYPHPDSRKNRYLHYGEWCILNTTKAGRPDNSLYLWFGVRYDNDNKEQKARLVCEIRKEDDWNPNCSIEGNEWKSVTDEAVWHLISRTAGENVGLQEFIQSVVNEVSSDRTSG